MHVTEKPFQRFPLPATSFHIVGLSFGTPQEMSASGDGLPVWQCTWLPVLRSTGTPRKLRSHDPSQTCRAATILVNPMRRSPFEQLEDILDRVSRWQVNQGMHMFWVYIVDLHVNPILLGGLRQEARDSGSCFTE